MILVYDSKTGNSEKIAQRFKMNSKDFRYYRDTSEDIVIMARKFYYHENLWEISLFIEQNKDKILGAIIYDDKNFGREFGNSSLFFEEKGIKVIDIWDKIVSDVEIQKMEERLNELSR